MFFAGVFLFDFCLIIYHISPCNYKHRKTKRKGSQVGKRRIKEKKSFRRYPGDLFHIFARVFISSLSSSSHFTMQLLKKRETIKKENKKGRQVKFGREK